MANTTDCPGTLNCPALPRVSLDQAVIDLLESTAMGMEELDLCKLLEVNDSATNMVHAVANLEMMLKDKLEFISNNLYYPSTGESGSATSAQE